MSRHRIIIWFLLSGAMFGLSSCSERKLHEAQAVVAAADSLRAEGQTYTDSLSLAEAYRTLGNRSRFYPDDYAHACYHYGRLLREKDNPVEAMQVFINATHSRSRDYHILGRIYSNMGSLCHLAGEHQLSYDIYSQSTTYFLQEGDTIAYLYGLYRMAFEKAELADSCLCMAILTQIEHLGKTTTLQGLVAITEAELFLQLQEYDVAILHAKNALSLNDYNETATVLLAQAYSLKGVNDSAVYYAKRVLETSGELNDLNNMLYILTNDVNITDVQLVRETAIDRADAQKILEIRQGRLAQAVQLLEQDLNRKPDIRWLYVLIGIITLTGGVIGLSYTYRHSRQIKNNAKNQRKVLEQKCDALTHLSDKQLKDTIYWHDYAALCHFININLNNIVNKLLQLIPTLTEQNIRLCIVILLGCSYSRCADMLLLSKSSISKLKQIMAEKLGTDIKNLRATLLDIACKNG